jgi:hypothetical protein
MKRNMDLIRSILLIAEEQPSRGRRPPALVVDGVDDATVAKHIELLADAGFVEANLLRTETESAIRGQVVRITWQGHEFLDAARSNTIWAKAKTEIAAKAGSVPLELLHRLLLKMSARALDLPES